MSEKKAPPKEVPIKLEDWKRNIESLFQSPFSEKKDELRKLLNREVTRPGGEPRGNDSLERVFVQLLSTALNLPETGFAKALIDSRHFKWHFILDDDRTTALHHAVKNGKKDIATRIAQNHAEALDGCDIYNRTPLHYAARKGDVGLVKLLLVNGATVDAFDRIHQTPLHNVAMNPESISPDEQVKVVQELLRHGAEVNTRDSYGDSPLHDATKDLQYQDGVSLTGLLEILVQHGADVECRNADDLIPRYVLHGSVPLDVHKIFDQHFVKWTNDRSYTIPTGKPQCWNSTTAEEPGEDHSMSSNEQKLDICHRFFAHVQFFFRGSEISWAQSVSIHELIHGHTATMQRLEDRFIELVKKDNNLANDAIRSDIWMWIHIPVNQMSWVRDLVWWLTEDNGSSKGSPQLPKEEPNGPPKKRKEAWDFLQRNTAQRKGVNPKYFTRMPHAGDLVKGLGGNVQDSSHYTAEVLDPDFPPERETESDSMSFYRRDFWRNTTSMPEGDKISIVVPYIDIESEMYLKHYDRNEDDELKIDSLRFQNMRELERKSLPYKGLSGLYRAQTLDQSYYAMISNEDLHERNRDQIVYKWIEENLKEEKKRREKKGKQEERNPENSETEPMKEGSEKSKTSKEMKGQPLETTKEAQGSSLKLLMVNQLWLWKLDKDTVITAFPDRVHQGNEYTLLETIRKWGIGSYQRPEQLIEEILYKCVTFLEEFWYAGLGIHILDIFENALAKRSNEEAKCFKKFVAAQDAERSRLAQKIDTEINAIHEVKDIYDELHLLLRIFEAQQDVVKKFAAVFWPAEQDDRHGKSFVQDCGLDHLIERTKNLDKRAKRIVDDLNYHVQMKQAQGSLDEAKRAGHMNVYILLFTFITIIFTPLSFMTSLFAIPFDYFLQDGNIVVPPKWTTNRLIAGEFITIGVIVITILIIYYIKKYSLVKIARAQWHKSKLYKLYGPSATNPEDSGTPIRSYSTTSRIRKNRPNSATDEESRV